ncbi:ABC transporter ATP-binding protein [Bariatricus massiliensis]|uniref:ABC transporter ATP-binding protein n=1 Tax=Bariatricus massiliensis TaxID=1745713 RepID=A0ABS8DGP8_9FIRM|nr:ABC transporter ATP-binding protein [Bariatricus massiliensis]MCB7304471.1 ABC transporter ATP-binding protein [Bariatricus massiliensis]MCB7375123.1 ABC transporter ATP-binding protein [Bariatricus massiliensis]MCB7387582.1 ABC transporter ATP-binding protein [Bariatricus massiliensis]MCB7411743.1 ABC transporter ATP-binding protein [Bariatricus massiliensis]MCQ5253879.1 ABC transporter ATP-binding protein [Bariatricus massiliensis]
MEVLRTKGLKKIYNTPSSQIRALDGIDISVEEGEFIAIVGSSGSGKTTLLNMLGGLDNPTEGEIIVRGKNLTDMDSEELTVFRRRNIGFVFQNYNLMPILNVHENMTLPLKLDGLGEDRNFLEQIIESLKLKEKLYSMPNTLSGGQQQRVAIARALVARPAVILADEPTGNLDSKTGTEVIGLLKTSAIQFNQTILVVTHNEDIAQMADRIIRIEDGKVSGGGHEE